MKNGMVFLFGLLVALNSYAQHEFVVVNDFETEVGSWSGIVIYGDSTFEGDPVHSGNWAGMMEVSHAGGWSDARYTFPEPFDATEADEFRMWVYSDQPFRMRVDLIVDVVMGFRTYTPEDVGTWKEFVFWISEEQTALLYNGLQNASNLRMWINPDTATVNGVQYPSGFEGTIYVDDMRIRKRIPVEREYLPILGFNEISDEEYVRLIGGGRYFEVNTSGFPEPTEGTGTLAFEYTSGWNENIEINLKDFSQIAQYDRIHFDIYIEGTGSWAADGLIFKCSWVDANGNNRGTGWTTLSENILLSQHIGKEWAELSGQYGPVESEGYVNNWLFPEIEGVFDDPNGTFVLSITSQGDGPLDGVLAYIDNLRLSRPVGTSIHAWPVY